MADEIGLEVEAFQGKFVRQVGKDKSLIEYPDTRYREELMFLILKSSYLLADNSIPEKQRERYQAAVDEYYSFIGEFPEGPHSREARRIYDTSSEFLKGNSNEES